MPEADQQANEPDLNESIHLTSFTVPQGAALVNASDIPTKPASPKSPANPTLAKAGLVRDTRPAQESET